MQTGVYYTVSGLTAPRRSLGHAAALTPQQPRLAHSRSAITPGPLSFSWPKPASAAVMGPDVGTPALAVKLGIGGGGGELGPGRWVRAWQGNAGALSPQNAGTLCAPAALLKSSCPGPVPALCRLPVWLWAGCCPLVPQFLICPMTRLHDIYPSFIQLTNTEDLSYVGQLLSQPASQCGHGHRLSPSPPPGGRRKLPPASTPQGPLPGQGTQQPLPGALLRAPWTPAPLLSIPGATSLSWAGTPLPQMPAEPRLCALGWDMCSLADPFLPG